MHKNPMSAYANHLIMPVVFVIAINMCNYLLCITIWGEWLNQLQNNE